MHAVGSTAGGDCCKFTPQVTMHSHPKAAWPRTVSQWKRDCYIPKTETNNFLAIEVRAKFVK